MALHRRRAHDRRTSAEAGTTLVELMVSILASSIVVLSLGQMMTANHAMTINCRSRAVLQQDVSRILAQITRDVRESRWIAAQGAGVFRTYAPDGTATHVYRRDAISGAAVITRDGLALATNRCDSLLVAASNDSTILTVTLGMSDDRHNTITGLTSVSVRNHAMVF